MNSSALWDTERSEQRAGSPASLLINPEACSAVEFAAVHGVTNTAPPPECPTRSGIFLGPRIPNTVGPAASGANSLTDEWWFERIFAWQQEHANGPGLQSVAYGPAIGPCKPACARWPRLSRPQPGYAHAAVWSATTISLRPQVFPAPAFRRVPARLSFAA